MKVQLVYKLQDYYSIVPEMMKNECLSFLEEKYICIYRLDSDLFFFLLNLNKHHTISGC